MAESGTKLKFPPHIAWRRVGDEVVVLDLNTSVYYSLNETAGRFWELIGDGVPEEEIKETVTEEYGASADRVSRDFVKFLGELQKEKLLEQG